MIDNIYLSDSGPKVSQAVYGFYRWQEDAEHSYEAMSKIVHLCLELGINTFDHADVYGGYQAEQNFGQLFKSKQIRRDEIVLFSKCGLVVPHPSRPHIRIQHFDTSGQHIVKSVEQSLRNLHTDYLDIFLLDHLDPLSNLEETALSISRLRSSGKIRNVGISNFSVFQHQLLASYLQVPIVTNHIELNLLNTSALDNGQLDFLKQRFTRPLASAPLASGRIEHGIDALAYQVRACLKEISARHDAHIESVAVAWLVQLGALPLIGTTSETRIRNIAKAFSIKLDPQEWYELYASTKI
jgi:predicted oxidoreductase